MKEYMKDIDIINKDVSIEFVKKESYMKISKYDSLKVKGISLSNDIIYVSNNIGSEALTENVLNTEIEVSDSDDKKL